MVVSFAPRRGTRSLGRRQAVNQIACQSGGTDWASGIRDLGKCSAKALVELPIGAAARLEFVRRKRGRETVRIGRAGSNYPTPAASDRGEPARRRLRYSFPVRSDDAESQQSFAITSRNRAPGERSTHSRVIECENAACDDASIESARDTLAP